MLTGKEANNIIVSAAGGEKTITEKQLGSVRDDRFDTIYDR